jgi:hypothetical protein
MAQCRDMAEQAIKEEKMLYIKSVQNSTYIYYLFK